MKLSRQSGNAHEEEVYAKSIRMWAHELGWPSKKSPGMPCKSASLKSFKLENALFMRNEIKVLFSYDVR